ncbi:hypothetical protein J6590_011536 [Homalodisca vitripennis]|nr:hypothetical protein J6590_011536 [Homalodisca vitripennis]
MIKNPILASSLSRGCHKKHRLPEAEAGRESHYLITSHLPTTIQRLKSSIFTHAGRRNARVWECAVPRRDGGSNPLPIVPGETDCEVEAVPTRLSHTRFNRWKIFLRAKQMPLPLNTKSEFSQCKQDDLECYLSGKSNKASRLTRNIEKNNNVKYPLQIALTSNEFLSTKSILLHSLYL